MSNTQLITLLMVVRLIQEKSDGDLSFYIGRRYVKYGSYDC